MPDIILSTLNARYSHCSLGLRYLKANMGELYDKTLVQEFVIGAKALDIAESLLAHSPKIIGISVYIWNVEEVEQVVALLKTISPRTIVVLGGPEVSFEHQEQTLVEYADYVICGQADLSFAELCLELLNKDCQSPKVIQSLPLSLEQIQLPYEEYTDEDIAQRNIYVEASRGCPFKCEFCLSALDKTAKPFDLDLFLGEMQKLYIRGARNFRFVDRTFNIKVETSARILQFFLDRMDESLFVHFEVIPDHLPDRLKELIVRFPAGSLQFEVGVQSFNPDVQALISRRQDNEKTRSNLLWLRENTKAHIHADLIAGLPGEDIQSFANGFDELYSLKPHEIQLGILKRLRGSPIIRHTAPYDLRFNPNPPYNILSTTVIAFPQMQEISRFARYWDLIANSGRFGNTLTLILSDSPFARFMAFSTWMYQRVGRQHKLSPQSLFQLLHEGGIEALSIDAEQLYDSLERDFMRSGIKGSLDKVLENKKHKQTVLGGLISPKLPARQNRHIRNDD